MAISTAPSLRSRMLAPFSIALYALLLAGVLYFYLRGVFILIPYRDRIFGGIAELWPRYVSSIPVPSFWVILGILALIVLAVLLGRQVSALVGRVPLQVRGLALPLPVYLVVTHDYVGSGALVVLAAAVFMFHKELGALLRARLARVPRFVWQPFARFWPAMLYAALFSRSVTVTLSAIVIIWAIHFLDVAMEGAFGPVWDWLRALPPKQSMGLTIGRMLVAFTAPFALSYSLSWFNPNYDRATLAYGLLTALLCFFLARGPAPRMSLPTSGGLPRPAMATATLSPLLVLGAAAGSAGLLSLGLTEVAYADDCSGPSDCAGTTWFNNAIGNSLGSLGGSVLGALTNTLFPNGVPPELQSVYQAYQLQNMMVDGFQKAKAEGWYTGNYTYVGKTGRMITCPIIKGRDWLCGYQQGYCGEMVEVSDRLFKAGIQKMFPGAKVDQAVVLERSTMNDKESWGNWFDSWADVNHVATRVTMPDGKVYIIDLWEALGSGQPRIMTETEWVNKWKQEIGPNDFYYDGWNGDTPPPARPAVRVPPSVKPK